MRTTSTLTSLRQKSPYARRDHAPVFEQTVGLTLVLLFTGLLLIPICQRGYFEGKDYLPFAVARKIISTKSARPYISMIGRVP